MPRLSKVRQAPIRATGPLKVRDVVADVQALHTVPVHAGAVFQVASQFNMLEMVSPRVSPEQGLALTNTTTPKDRLARLPVAQARFFATTL
ncbi:hypothetical protein [Ascidiaceihabitans sp.]|uniref:hypothetical protein n=1 Tax=Ascidiaceihabitans sp. TaxID=1872644 RepID=UPI0032977B91